MPVPPFIPPLPTGSSQREREALLHDWLLAEVTTVLYTRRVGASLVANGGVPTDDTRAASRGLVELRNILSDGRDLVQRAIDGLKTTGDYDDEWPQTAEDIVQLAIETYAPDKGLGLWPVVIAAVLVALASAVVLAGLAYVLAEFSDVYEELPTITAVVRAAAVPMVLVGLGLLWWLAR